MPLELRYDYAQRPRLLQDGKEIKGVRLVVVEADLDGVQVQVELTPQMVSTLENGAVTWVVGCTNCQHNSVHTCDIATKEEVTELAGEPAFMVADEVHEDRTVSGRVYPT